MGYNEDSAVYLVSTLPNLGETPRIRDRERPTSRVDRLAASLL